LHWHYPPNPAEYQSLGLGLLIAVFAIVSVCVAVVFYAVQSSGPLLHELEPQPELDEKTSEEKYRKKTTE
jgi:hypothetical protein